MPDWGDSTTWQYWVIHTIKEHEQRMGYDQHPVGMTMQFQFADQRRVNAPLLNSRADWISPGYDDDAFAEGGHPGHDGSPESRWYIDPPAGDGTKVILTDTDHYAAGKGDPLWVWKSFLRGHHPILMDYGLIAAATAPNLGAGTPEYEAFEPVRRAMGDTRRFAERIDLSAMVQTANSLRLAMCWRTLAQSTSSCKRATRRCRSPSCWRRAPTVRSGTMSSGAR
ncbi:MAG: hypothetical protein U0232_21515 [Thermomicrobiales bacterium]